jgi:hypothetical protein
MRTFMPTLQSDSFNKWRSKRQRTAALQDAVATDCKLLLPRGLGVRLSSAAFVNFRVAGLQVCRRGGGAFVGHAIRRGCR